MLHTHHGVKYLQDMTVAKTSGNTFHLTPQFLLIFLRFQVVSARSSFSSMRTLQPTLNSAWEEGSSSSKRFTAAAVAAGGLFLGAGSLAACDSAKQTNVMDPQTFPFQDILGDTDDFPAVKATSVDVKDPMTEYAKHAIKMELKAAAGDESETEVKPAKVKVATPEATQATSPKLEVSATELRIEESTRKAKQHSGGLKLFSGNGNMALAVEVSKHLGINLGKATVSRFADGECNIVIHENIRGKDVYIIQPTCPPVNDNMMELLLMVSTLRRASARRITVVIPYYGYARQDRKMQVRLQIFVRSRKAL